MIERPVARKELVIHGCELGPGLEAFSCGAEALAEVEGQPVETGASGGGYGVAEGLGLGQGEAGDGDVEDVREDLAPFGAVGGASAERDELRGCLLYTSPSPRD